MSDLEDYTEGSDSGSGYYGSILGRDTLTEELERYIKTKLND